MIAYFARIFAWVAAHPFETVQGVLLVWGVLNVLWAQLPKPTSPFGIAVWKWTHTIFLLVSTHASAGGTFTWPSLIRAVMAGLLNQPAPDPFGPTTEVKNASAPAGTTGGDSDGHG